MFTFETELDNLSFIKRKENFTCEACGHQVSGSGYTNHCPNCLISKHVDLEFPGDRESSCQGLMDAVGVKLVGGQPVKLLFRCRKCQKSIFNLISDADNKELIVNLQVL